MLYTPFTYRWLKLPEISWKLPTGDISHVGIYSVVIWQHSSFSVFCPFYKVEEAMLLTSNLELLFILDPSFELGRWGYEWYTWKQFGSRFCSGLKSGSKGQLSC